MPEGEPERRRRQWRWWVSPSTGRRSAREEFDALPVHGRAALYAAIKRYERGESLSSEVKALQGAEDLRELRVQVGSDPFRLIFFADSPVHDVCVLAIYKNQRKLPKGDLERALKRRREWRAAKGS